MRLVKRLSQAWNIVTGRYSQLDPDGFPVFSSPMISGPVVSPDTAMRESTVYACVDLLSSVIASIPLVIYQRKGLDVSEMTTDPLYQLLRYEPNNIQSPYDYWLWNVESILLRGGFISWKIRNSAGKVLRLIPINPDCLTRRTTKTGDLVFSGSFTWGSQSYELRDEPADSFFWANYRTFDGINPVSPIRYAAETIGLAITATNHGTSVFQNDATPPLVISYNGKLDPAAMKNLAVMWKAGGSGSNYGMPRVIDGGSKIEKMSMSNEDAQYLETRRFQKEEICGIFRVPPSMIGDTARAQGWSTLEQKNSDFLTYTLSPPMSNIEQSVRRSLIPRQKWDTMFADFDTDHLMKADVAARTRYYESMKRVGALSANEIRMAEGYNRRTDGGGDEYESVNSSPAPTQETTA